MKTIRGAGGSQSSSRAPIEAPDSLISTAFARILDLLSEGEIVGLVDGLKSVYLDETPIANADDSLNFANVQVETRNGTQDQTYIKGIPAVENEIGVGVDLEFDDPWTQAITNVELSALRVRLSVSVLTSTNTSNGDISGHKVAYAIDLATDGGAFVEVLVGAFNGKTTTGYERSIRIDLPDATTGWTIRVRRTTEQSVTSAIQDRTRIESYTQIIDGKFRYPNSALAMVAVDAEQFQAIPSRAYHAKGRIVSVPSNYDAETRTYDGIWDGTFQPAYTKNPAWIFYDLALHSRYGLGHLIEADQIDKWELYRIGQYCDELVDDGKGGEEPRFECSIYMQTAADAYKVMQDLCSVFRGITYWGAGQIRVGCDMPTDVAYLYTNANVVNGKFSYQGSARKTRFNVALVSWNDMTDFGRAKIELVEDEEGIARNGIQKTNMIAVGCTSQGQAARVGRWALVTSRYETQVVSFGVGIEGTLSAPGQIIEIADRHRAGKRYGGRINVGYPSYVVVDSVPEDIVVGDTISCMLPTGVPEQRIVHAILGRIISVTVDFSAAPVSQSVFIVQSETVQAQKFKVIGVSENEDYTFTISAMQHNTSKYDAVEDGTPVTVPSITQLPSKVQYPPNGIVVTHRFVLGLSGVTTVVNVDWEPTDGAVAYEVGYRINSGGWVNVGGINDSIFDIFNVPEGFIEIRVTAINSSSRRSVPTHVPPYAVPEAPASIDFPAVDLSIVSGVVTVDCTYENFRLALTEDATVVFINVPSVRTAIIEITNAGGFTLAFPPSVTPVSGVPYVATPAAGAKDVVGLSTVNAGISWDLLATQPVDGGGGIFTASITPTSDSDSVATDGATPSAPSVSLTAATSGGTAPITGLWTRADAGGTDFLVDDPTSLTPVFSVASGVVAYPSTTQTWRFTATDAAALTATATATITLERTAPAGVILEYFDGEVANKTKLRVGAGNATAAVQFVVRRNGTWETQRLSPDAVIDSNDWISGPAADSGDTWNVKFTPTLTVGSSGGITNPASSYVALTSDRTINLSVTQVSYGTKDTEYDVLVEFEDAADPGTVVGSGTVTLRATATVEP